MYWYKCSGLISVLNWTSFNPFRHVTVNYLWFYFTSEVISLLKKMNQNPRNSHFSKYRENWAQPKDKWFYSISGKMLVRQGNLVKQMYWSDRIFWNVFFLGFLIYIYKILTEYFASFSGHSKIMLKTCCHRTILRFPYSKNYPSYSCSVNHLWHMYISGINLIYKCCVTFL